VPTTESFLRVLLTRWRQKSTGIDVEQNYVTVTLCITSVHKLPVIFVAGNLPVT